MDTDYLPQTIVFIVFALLFSYLSLLRSGGSAGPSVRDENTSALSEPLLFWLKAACFFAVVLSGVALIQSVVTTDWWPIAFMSAGLLAGLFVIDRAANLLARRHPGLSRPWTKTAHANGGSAFAANGQPSNGNGHGYSESELEEPAITEEELTSLDDRDREMLRSIIRLDATTVREVMVPRLDMAAVEADSPLEVVAETMVSRGHSRLPVYEETIDRILGIIHARDVMGSLAKSGKSQDSLRTLVRDAFIIPETKRVDDLLEELQERRTQIAIVVDEYGGTEGLVTMEDLLEEIVGGSAKKSSFHTRHARDSAMSPEITTGRRSRFEASRKEARSASAAASRGRGWGGWSRISGCRWASRSCKLRQRSFLFSKSDRLRCNIPV